MQSERFYLSKFSSGPDDPDNRSSLRIVLPRESFASMNSRNVGSVVNVNSVLFTDVNSDEIKYQEVRKHHLFSIPVFWMPVQKLSHRL